MRRVISLYTGIGGIDLGFEKAGFQTAVAVELDRACCAALRANRPWEIIEDNIHRVSSETILERAGLRPGDADVLIGGPPCQPFSKSGYWAAGDARRLDDPRASTLSAYLRVLRDAQPRVFMLENVPGLGFKGKAEGLEQVLAGVASINAECGTNYRPQWYVINAADYGVPQLRERLVMVGSRDGRPFKLPAPTHGEGLEPYRTAWDALGDLPDEPNEPGLRMTGKWADILPTIPEGHNYLWHTERGGGLPLFGWRRRYWNFLLKLAKDRPSWTIQAQPGSATGPFHWKNRKLSSRELCRLQTFPDDIVLAGGRGDIQRMIGNAVPSLLAEVMAWAIRAQLLEGKGHSASYALLPPSRNDRPAKEPCAALPQRFFLLIGDHPAHPGAGKGNRALLRVA